MKQTIELNCKDIERIIAKEFGVDEKQVDIWLKRVYCGYGTGEHKDYEVYAVVNKQADGGVNEV